MASNLISFPNTVHGTYTKVLRKKFCAYTALDMNFPSFHIMWVLTWPHFICSVPRLLLCSVTARNIFHSVKK
jgi:hypothetical protein